MAITSHGNDNGDWIEGFRQYWYPKLHPLLTVFGAYATASVSQNQYAGVLQEDEDAIELEFKELGVERNPIATFKSHPDGRKSEGSWVVRHNDVPTLIENGMQLHITLFKRRDGKPGREVYAHYEDDWMKRPIAHLRGANLDSEAGRKKVNTLLDQSTFLVLN